MQITAAVAREEGGELSLETVEMEAPRDDEILVRVTATGICHTDLVVRDGMMPTPRPVVLGHEGSGVVEAVGRAVTKVAPGDHVVMTVNSCGTCPACFDSERTYCHDIFGRNFAAARPDGSSALSKDGETIRANFFGQSSFASHALAHERNVVKVPADVDLALLGPLGCGIQTGAGTVMNALKVRPGRSFAVFGAGSVGLSAVMGAVVQGATTIVAVDKVPARLELARELGATHTLNSDTDDVPARLKEITGAGLNYAMDTTGIPVVIRQAMEALAPAGACAIVGASAPDSELTLNQTSLMSGGRRLMGVVEGESNPDVFIPALIGLWRAGRFPFDRLISFYSFEQINAAIRDSAEGRAVKPVVRMG